MCAPSDTPHLGPMFLLLFLFYMIVALQRLCISQLFLWGSLSADSEEQAVLKENFANQSRVLLVFCPAFSFHFLAVLKHVE